MAVLSALSVTLEVPKLDPGVQFYTDAGLVASVESTRARFSCAGEAHEAILLVEGGGQKRLHHISLRADDLGGMRTKVLKAGGRVVEPPVGFEKGGLWVTDPHGMLIRLADNVHKSELLPVERFAINAPGAIIRKHRSAMRPRASYAPAKPLRLGHLLVFSPDVMKSVEFAVEGLGMGLADRAQEVIAFCCARKDSDHHVVAFAKSPGVGFHHASFEVANPDEVGRAGSALLAKSGRGDWGFARHTIGSNFFHYIQDPWGSWFEYYSDMDHIADYSLWTPTNYGMEDSLANWGPAVPADFVHNYELDDPQTLPFAASVRV